MKKGVFLLTCALGLIMGMIIGVLATVGHQASEISGLPWKTTGGIPVIISPSTTLAVNVGIGTDTPSAKLSVVNGDDSAHLGATYSAVYANSNSGKAIAGQTYNGYAVYGRVSNVAGYGGAFENVIKIIPRSGQPFVCDSSAKGSMYYDSTGAGVLKFCNNNGIWKTIAGA